MPNFLSRREQEMVDSLDHDSLHHGNWGAGMPFVWQRRLYLWWSGFQDWAKERHCKRHGHNPGVIWLIDGIPYPPSKWFGKWETFGGGMVEFRGFCTHCWSHYALPWPCKNPDLELESYVRENYPEAIYLSLGRSGGRSISEMVAQELKRMNDLGAPRPA